MNLDKKEFINPHKLGTGLKLSEMIGSQFGVGSALVILTAAQKEARGGGDLDIVHNWHGPERDVMGKHGMTPGPMPEDYTKLAKQIIGRWAGDRIAIVGDYATNSDLPDEFQAESIYDRCFTQEEYDDLKDKDPERLKEVEKTGIYKDISDYVCKVIEHEMHGRYVGDGWRDFKFLEDMTEEEKKACESLAKTS